MADFTSVFEFLFNPFVSATISGLILLAVGYLIGRHSRMEEKKLVHSVELSRKILMPWSRVQIHHVDAWAGREPTFWHPKLVMDPHDLEEQPAFRWASEHLKSAYPGTLGAWSSVNDLVIDAETLMVESLKAKVIEEFARGVEREFQDRIVATDTKNDYKKDVYYADAVLYIIMAELWALARGRRKPPHPLELESAPLGGGAAYIGSSVTHGGYEVARVSQMADANKAAWQRVFESAINTQEIRASMQAIVAQDDLAQLELEKFRKELLEIIQKIEHGVPIEGRCELGF